MPLWTFTADRPPGWKGLPERRGADCTMDMRSRIVRLSARKRPKSVSRQRWPLDGGQCTLLTNKARILTIKH
jgi:hypothetical protein